jgi:hypothetical protein
LRTQVAAVHVEHGVQPDEPGVEHALAAA